MNSVPLSLSRRKVPPLNKVVRREYWLRLAAVIGLLAIGFWALLAVENLLVSFVLAFVISYLFNPIVSNFERKGYDRSLTIILLFLVSGVFVGVSISLVGPLVSSQLASIQSDLPKYAEGVTTLVANIEERLSSILSSVYEFNLSSSAGNFFQRWIGDTLSSIPTIAQKTFTTLILAPFFAFFMLRDGRSITRQLLAMVPNNLFEMALSLTHEINRQIGGFIRARLLEALIVGIVVWIGLEIIGFEYAPVLALFAGLTNLIPYVGPVIGAIPAFILALVNQDTGLTIVLMTSVYVIAQLIDMLFIIPLVVAKIVNLHPVTVVIVIIIGAQVLGVLGMIISIPATSALKLTVSTVYNHILGFRT